MREQPRIEYDAEGNERRFYECGDCEGTGILGPLDDDRDNDDCPTCDGMGEWFE